MEGKGVEQALGGAPLPAPLGLLPIRQNNFNENQTRDTFMETLFLTNIHKQTNKQIHRHFHIYTQILLTRVPIKSQGFRLRFGVQALP